SDSETQLPPQESATPSAPPTVYASTARRRAKPRPPGCDSAKMAAANPNSAFEYLSAAAAPNRNPAQPVRLVGPVPSSPMSNSRPPNIGTVSSGSRND